MIDERTMAVHRLQFDIHRQIDLLGLAAVTPHLVRLRFTALLLLICHGWSSCFLTASREAADRSRLHAMPGGPASRSDFQTAKTQDVLRSSLRAERSNPWSREERMDCFAPLAMTTRQASTFPRRVAPELLSESFAQWRAWRYPKGGAGNAGCPLHPQPRV